MGRGKNDHMKKWFEAAYYGQDNNAYAYDSTTDTATVSNHTNADDGMILASSSYSAATPSMKDINALQKYTTIQ